MHTIELDDDIDAHLLSNPSRIGEDASSILRRLFRAPTPRPPGHDGQAVVGSPLIEFVRSSDLLAHRNVTDRFLQIVAFAHRERPNSFGRILQVSGRRCCHFARSRKGVADSGRNTYPQQISSLRLWAVTNAYTEQKKDIHVRALKLLGYNPTEVRASVETLQ